MLPRARDAPSMIPRARCSPSWMIKGCWSLFPTSLWLNPQIASVCRAGPGHLFVHLVALPLEDTVHSLSVHRRGSQSGPQQIQAGSHVLNCMKFGIVDIAAHCVSLHTSHGWEAVDGERELLVRVSNDVPVVLVGKA
jgi:hypothetical protein